MNYNTIEDLAGYYMFIAACISTEEKEELKKEWNKQGGYEKIEWWEFIMNNTKIEVCLNK
ncbi:MAG TPA: hypothetical protein GXZ90_01905 [Clostridiales bacterium]|nr:hypothetical protein [Clostridiales bacterium]